MKSTLKNWQPDDSSSACTTCGEEFTTWMRRRHHCRACGCLVCADCSPNFTPLPDMGYNTAVRVCNDCNTPSLNYNSASDSPNCSDCEDMEFEHCDLDEAYQEITKHSKLKQTRLSYDYFSKSEAVNWILDTGIVRSRLAGVQLFAKLVEEAYISEKPKTSIGSCVFYVINDSLMMETRLSYYDSSMLTVTDKCQNCARSYLSNLTLTPGFCSIDCKTNAEFSHSDYLRAKKMCA